MKARLYPKLDRDQLPAMLAYAVMGAFLAGGYGVVHDQITYSISPEYFTRLKFLQFRYADFGLPPRVFAAEIGFLASWWVGFIAGWFLARVAVPLSPPRASRAYCFRGFGIVFACALAASLAGFGLGILRCQNADFSGWQTFAAGRGIVDLPHFVRVAYMHNASHLGGLIGLVLALVYLWRLRRDSH
jgi:hypothetical protein